MEAGRLPTPTQPSDILRTGFRNGPSRWAVALVWCSVAVVAIAIGLLLFAGRGAPP